MKGTKPAQLRVLQTFPGASGPGYKPVPDTFAVKAAITHVFVHRSPRIADFMGQAVI